MDVWLIAIGMGVFVCILVGYMSVSRKRRKKRIEEQVNRVKAANEPGYRWWTEDSLYTTVKDGVITYRKRRGGRKRRDYR